MPSLDTASAAAYLNRRPQTLRIWACYENGPIRPIRINGRLAWRTDDVRRLLQLATTESLPNGADVFDTHARRERKKENWCDVGSGVEEMTQGCELGSNGHYPTSNRSIRSPK